MPADAITKRTKGLDEALDGDFSLYPERPIAVFVRPPKPMVCVLCGPSDAIVGSRSAEVSGCVAGFLVSR